LAHGVFRSGGGKIEGGLKAERVFIARSIRYFIKMPRPPAVFNHQNPISCHFLACGSKNTWRFGQLWGSTFYNA
jgi:hypothetical protein